MEKKNFEGIREMGAFHYIVKERKERGKKIEWVYLGPQISVSPNGEESGENLG